jgi:hypothetical protein
VTFVLALTADVRILNFADVVPPAGTVTLAGTLARLGFELASVTTDPPAGAAPFSTMVLFVVVFPPPVATGFSATLCTCTGSTVRTNVLVTPPKMAEIVTGVEVATGVVEISNGGEVAAPCGTITAAGTDNTEEFELLNVTPAPPAGAAPFSVTVFEPKLEPPATLDLEMDIESSAVCPTTSVALLLLPPSEAVMVTEV